MKKPQSEPLGDQEVPQLTAHLQGQKVALLVSGGIAAMYVPMLARELRKHGAMVWAYLSPEAARFVTSDTMNWCTGHNVVTKLSASAEHLKTEHHFDLYLLVPATYNTINKVRRGIADNSVCTSMATALGRMEAGLTKVAICPTMHGDMHNSILDESLNHLQKMGVKVITPRDEYGKHNIPSIENLVAQVIRFCSRGHLKGKRVLVTGGPTPVYLDGIRQITNKFTGSLGLAVALELYFRGAEVEFILGASGLDVPEFLSVHRVGSYAEYESEVLRSLKKSSFDYSIFSAAVADYKPVETISGKISSGQQMLQFNLVPTEKIIDKVLTQFKVPIVSFKYEEDIKLDELFAIGQQKLDRGHIAVVANRGEDFLPSGEQVAYLMQNQTTPQKIVGKQKIAVAIADFLVEQSKRTGQVSMKGNIDVETDTFSPANL